MHGQISSFPPAVLATPSSCPLLAVNTSITPNYLILPPQACSATLSLSLQSSEVTVGTGLRNTN